MFNKMTKIVEEETVCGGTVLSNNSHWKAISYTSTESATTCAISIPTDWYRHYERYEKYHIGNERNEEKDHHKWKDFHRPKRHICQIRLVNYNIYFYLANYYETRNN